jgi:hypothetical protein
MRCKQSTNSNIIDGVSTPDGIATHLAEKYQDLYTSVSYNESDMTDIVHELNILLSESGFKSNCIITCYDVDLAVCKLKLNKNDGNRGLSSNHIKHGNNKLNVHISFLLTGILCHGCVPDDYSLVQLFLFLKVVMLI